MTCCRVTPRRARRWGSTCTCSCRSRCPKIETLATPGTPSSLGRIVQRASTDISMGETSSERNPTTRTRLEDESGWTITGGSVRCASRPCWVSRSWTTCRASRRSVPGSKISVMEDSPFTDSERMPSRNATPLSSRFSIGAVISCSTSSADSPSASVCTSTYGGENSGSASVLASRDCSTPSTTSPAASASTSARAATEREISHAAIGVDRLSWDRGTTSQRAPWRCSGPLA